MTEKIKAFFDAIDLIAARLRGYMKSLVAVGVTLQTLVATGVIKIPPGSKWANWAAIGTAVIAYFTIRSGKEVSALVEAKRLAGEPPMPGVNPPRLTGGPTFPPPDGAVPSREMDTPNERPSKGSR